MSRIQDLVTRYSSQSTAVNAPFLFALRNMGDLVIVGKEGRKPNVTCAGRRQRHLERKLRHITPRGRAYFQVFGNSRSLLLSCVDLPSLIEYRIIFGNGFVIKPVAVQLPRLHLPGVKKALWSGRKVVGVLSIYGY